MAHRHIITLLDTYVSSWGAIARACSWAYICLYVRPTGGTALIFLTQLDSRLGLSVRRLLWYGVLALFALIISFRVENSMTFNLRVDHVCAACLYLVISSFKLYTKDAAILCKESSRQSTLYVIESNHVTSAEYIWCPALDVKEDIMLHFGRRTNLTSQTFMMNGENDSHLLIRSKCVVR